MTVLHLYRTPGVSKSALNRLLVELNHITTLIEDVSSEYCFNIEVENELPQEEFQILSWLLSPPFQPDVITTTSALLQEGNGCVIEIGPRLNFSTPFSSNALSICKAVGINSVTRLERSVRYLLKWSTSYAKVDEQVKNAVTLALHDRMTECEYLKPIDTFDHGITPEKWFMVDVLKEGKLALEKVNSKLGLAFDDWDLDYYTNLFKERLGRNPTSVECFDLAQSNSEHSRHWFFKGKMFLDKVEQPESLMTMILKTQNTSNPNNVIKFSDNSSAIKGFELCKLQPSKVGLPSNFTRRTSTTHITFTAETHNFPTGVAPFSGATTGTGGRLRDVEAVGRGGHCIAGTAGYSVGNLHIPDYAQPWEDPSYEYPPNLATPLKILIDASNGASDYGNKFGEPVVAGFTRSYGMKDAAGVRKEWVKPIMFSGGIGSMEGNMVSKMVPEPGMKVVKIGGPVYRIGVGGGSASSVQVQGDNASDLDFGAVQRGDAEMENKLNRIIRGCIEDSTGNIICSIHDQGAGGNGNVLKELVEPSGAIIFSKAFSLGDPSVSTMELWGAEYQESNAVLVRSEDASKLTRLSKRERCPVDIVGTVTGNGKVILSEEENMDESKYMNQDYSKSNQLYPFNLELDLVLGKMPQKSFYLEDKPITLSKLVLLSTLTVFEALNRVLRSVSVCSKRFLTNKVDRCVTGLVAQQQCVGPLHTPLADCAVVSLSMYDTKGAATAIGEQPIKGLLNPEAGARMSVAESISNLAFAKISCLKDVKCSGNWMWAAKLPGEGAYLYRACKAMCNFMAELGIAVDGGKDSLSMAARVKGESIVAPGTLVVSTYAPCPDVRVKVTPDIKSPRMGQPGVLLWISVNNEKRLGGSAFAQCFSQLGDDAPDVEDPLKLKSAFNTIQKLVEENKILSGHDISDGGLITCILEMAFGGLSGLQIRLNTGSKPIETLFSEEVGWVIEVPFHECEYVTKMFERASVNCCFIGQAAGYGMMSTVTLSDTDGNLLLDARLGDLFKMWEETSFRLECRQANHDCVSQEFNALSSRKGVTYKVTFDTNVVPKPARLLASPPKVAVIREEGSNGDREMAVSLEMAGFEVWDIVMQDLLDGQVFTDQFRGIIFPGGFSYADVLGSAKGWAASMMFNVKLREQFNHFAKRKDTFSLGVCNGCQLMALLGWISPCSNGERQHSDIVLDHNLSERFECRFSTVRVEKSLSIMLDGMTGSELGVWVAHGEGRFTFKNESVFEQLKKSNAIALKYLDDEGLPTEDYPMNPNGSPDGIAALCSPDGRHLAMMPHPERCTLMWQWPYVSPNLESMTRSPWMRLFDNAFVWCQNSS